MKKIKLIFLLTPLIFLIASSGQISTISKICAGTSIDNGIDCEPNYTDCGGNNENILELFTEGSITMGNHLNRSKLIASLNGYAGGDTSKARSMCIKPGYDAFLVRWMEQNEAGAGENFSAVDSQRTIEAIPRVCPTGWNVQSGPNTIFGSDGIFANGFRMQGCCPIGFQFVNRVSDLDEWLNGGFALQGGACCRGSGFTSWDPDPSNGGCKVDDTVVIRNSEQINRSHANLEDAIIDMQNNAQIIIGVDQNNGWNTSIPGVNTNGVVRPQFGLGLGENYPGAIVIEVPASSGAATKCPSNTACAISGDPGTPDINSIVSADTFIQSGTSATCGRCYTNGDTIGTVSADAGAVDDPNTPVDESIGFVRYCDTSAPNGLFRDETLLGTPDITRGYLLEDATNQALYKQCFDTGGIYTAVGCIDPTPTGIITGLIRIALGVMGGVALLQMVYVGILYQQGNTEKIKGARTQLIATLTGVAVLVFSVLILRIIGVNILDVIPAGSV